MIGITKMASTRQDHYQSAISQTFPRYQDSCQNFWCMYLQSHEINRTNQTDPEATKAFPAGQTTTSDREDLELFCRALDRVGREAFRFGPERPWASV